MQRARERDQRFDTGSVIVPLEACLCMENPLAVRIARALLHFPRDSSSTDYNPAMPESLEPPEPAEVVELAEKLRESNEHGGRTLFSTSIAISVLTILSSVLMIFSHRAATEYELSERKASDQWQFYLQKSMTSRLRNSEADLLELLSPLQTTPRLTSEETNRRDEIRKTVSRLQGQQQKWQDDSKEVTEKAQQFEALSARMESQVSRIGSGQSLLQIAVVLCSITLYTRKRLYLYIGLSIGSLGFVVAITAFLR